MPGRVPLQTGSRGRLGTYDVEQPQLLPHFLLHSDVFTRLAMEGCFHTTLGPGLGVAFAAFLLFLTPFPSCAGHLRHA